MKGTLLAPESVNEGNSALLRVQEACVSFWRRTKAGVLDAFETLNGGKAHRLLLSNLEDLEAINTALVDRIEGLEGQVSKLERSERIATRIAIASAAVALLSLLAVLAR
jgi:hypothetical protein